MQGGIEATALAIVVVRVMVRAQPHHCCERGCERPVAGAPKWSRCSTFGGCTSKRKLVWFGVARIRFLPRRSRQGTALSLSLINFGAIFLDSPPCLALVAKQTQTHAEDNIDSSRSKRTHAWGQARQQLSRQHPAIAILIGPKFAVVRPHRLRQCARPASMRARRSPDSAQVGTGSSPASLPLILAAGRLLDCKSDPDVPRALLKTRAPAGTLMSLALPRLGRRGERQPGGRRRRRARRRARFWPLHRAALDSVADGSTRASGKYFVAACCAGRVRGRCDGRIGERKGRHGVAAPMVKR